LGAAARGEYVSILCKDGVTRKYQMTEYSKLVAHTQTSMAANEGALNMAQVAGIDLVQWSVHDSPCDECLLLQGEVFSISGDSPDFPTLTDEETPPIHPHCGHRLLPVSDEWLREEGQYDTLSEFSNSNSTVNTADEYAELLA
jgi:hypothetical protein